MVKGWLVLTPTSLSFYDRDPTYTTRRPSNTFVLNKPGVFYILIPSIGSLRLPGIPMRSNINVFGLEIFQAGTSKMVYLMASSIQCKNSWVETIQKVLTLQFSSPLTVNAAKPVDQCVAEKGSSEDDYALRQVKLSVVPICSPPERLVGKGSQPSRAAKSGAVKNNLELS